MRSLRSLPHLRDVHDLHASQVATGLPVLTAHVVVDDSCFHDGHLGPMLNELHACLAEHFDVEHSTIHFEEAAHADHEHETHTSERPEIRRDQRGDPAVADARDAELADRLTRVRARQSYADPTRTALRLVGLTVVLMGLFGMHGLANHSVGGMENMPRVIAQASVGPLGSTLDLAPVSPSRQAGSLAEPIPGMAALTSGLGDEGMGMHMAGLCVAILAVGLFALLLLLRGGRLPRALWFLQHRAFALNAVGRDPDPPSLAVLSIQRC